MRIIAGSAKGTRLGPVPRGVRPVSDRAREGLFSHLGDVTGDRVLDLYAGTGAMGIEALSRGAGAAVFVDRSPASLRAVRDNLARTRLSGPAHVVPAGVDGFLRGKEKPAGGFHRFHPFHLFHLCFLDPPYAAPAGELDAALAALADRWLWGSGCRVVLTRPRGGYTPVIPVDWALERRLEYGDTLVFVYREV